MGIEHALMANFNLIKINGNTKHETRNTTT